MFSLMEIARAIMRHDAYLGGVRWLRNRFQGRSWRPLVIHKQYAQAALSPFGEANRANPAEENTPRCMTTIGGCKTRRGWFYPLGAI